MVAWTVTSPASGLPIVLNACRVSAGSAAIAPGFRHQFESLGRDDPERAGNPRAVFVDAA